MLVECILDLQCPGMASQKMKPVCSLRDMPTVEIPSEIQWDHPVINVVLIVSRMHSALIRTRHAYYAHAALEECMRYESSPSRPSLGSTSSMGDTPHSSWGILFSCYCCDGVVQLVGTTSKCKITQHQVDIITV